MKALLIVNKKQFGYHTDTQELIKHLSNNYKITYVCFDSGLDKFNLPNLEVIYINSSGSFFRRGLRFISQTAAILKNRRDLCMVYYFPFCSLINLFANRKIKLILDFRTGSVDNQKFKRVFNNLLRTYESIFFKRVVLISEGLRKRLMVPKKKSFILSLGANELSSTSKVFDSPRLFYIGTFKNRNIENTILGLDIFMKEHPNLKPNIVYDIVGYGYKNENQRLKDLVIELGLENHIFLHGRLNHSQCQSFFDKANIGVSYIPITSYFNFQPPTKTFEYILSGMFCLATSTVENSKYITKQNGVLHLDSPEDFALGLKKAINSFPNLDSNKIRNTLMNCRWINISERLMDYLEDAK